VIGISGVCALATDRPRQFYADEANNPAGNKNLPIIHFQVDYFLH
jgi:hypothetical protein